MKASLHRVVAAALVLAALPLSAGEVAPPQPYGPLPDANQLRWHRMEFYGFLHFGMNTFTGRDWGYGDSSPSLFDPVDFDADAIAETARAAGMRGLVLVCKHHDGFCLWPTATTEHSVKSSPWRGGEGDVVGELAEACRRSGIRFGVYLSPWDRNNEHYGRPEYVEIFRNQLRELLTDYGEVFVSWHDGAYRGTGYYGGANEPRLVDISTYYDWPGTWKLIRELQPRAVIFSDVGPGIRWGGSEKGEAGDPCWYTLRTEGRHPGFPGWTALVNGDREGPHWIPPECPVSIRAGWFHHERHDRKVKSAAQLVDIYYKTVGRGAALNLNVPPDRRGRLHERDVESLLGMRAILEATFAEDLARGAKLSATNVRGGAERFGADRLVDGDRESYWCTDEGTTEVAVVLEFARPVRFDVVRLREHLPLGQRVEAFALDLREKGDWKEFFAGTSVGNQRLVRTEPVETDAVRLRIVKSPAPPVPMSLT